MADSMSRDEKVAVVEQFLHCMARNQIDRLPIGPDLTVESPLVPKLSGEAAMDYVKAVGANMKGIQVVQHIVEGDHVATLTENETINGTLSVFSKFQLESGRVKDLRVFYDPRRLAAGE